MRATLSAYSDYPRFFMFTNLLIVGYTYLQNFIIAKSYGVENTGYYSLANSITGIPVQLFSLAVAPLFYQKFSELYDSKSQNLIKNLRKSMMGLSAISLIPFSVLALFGADLFSFFFGKEWTRAGEIASLLSMYYYFFFIVYPFTSLFRVFRKLKPFFYLNLIICLCGSSSLYFVSTYEDMTSAIYVFVGLSIVFQCITIYLVFRTAKKISYSWVTNSISK
ncbi:MAG TPA: oligosaccharide flippase family protein [Niabella sp.]|nr:oligosaccharide flippase family protein [Niabella sp.]